MPEPEFEALAVTHPALERLLGDLAALYAKVAFGCFAVTDLTGAHWYTWTFPEQGKLDLGRLLSSPAFGHALPGVRPEQPVPCEPAFQWLNPLMLDGSIADALVAGGAYTHQSYPGTVRQAKQVATDVCGVMLGEVYFDKSISVQHDGPFNGRYPNQPWLREQYWVHSYYSDQPWSEWFFGAGCGFDRTWVVLTERRQRIWILCVTDTD